MSHPQWMACGDGVYTLYKCEEGVHVLPFLQCLRADIDCYATGGGGGEDGGACCR